MLKFFLNYCKSPVITLILSCNCSGISQNRYVREIRVVFPRVLNRFPQRLLQWGKQLLDDEPLLLPYQKNRGEKQEQYLIFIAVLF